MDVFIARQPIFDRESAVYGYELFYREAGEEFFNGVDGDLATSSVIAGNFLSQDVHSWAAHKKTFINFTQNLRSMDIVTLFPADQLIVEIVEMDDTLDNLLVTCERIKSLGYTIAMGAFVLMEENQELLEYADIVKISLLNKNGLEIRKLITPFLKQNVKFLAEKVETRAVYHRALEYGFTYFQGFYFSKPEILQSKMVNANKISMIRLINAVNRTTPDFNELTSIIEMDPAFSYEMLRIANTAYFSRGNRISSIKQALVRMGLEEIQKWCYITVIRKNATSQNDEIMNYSMLRAKFLEQFAVEMGLTSQSPEFMTVGILSMLDVLTDSPMEYVLEELSLSDNVKKSLLGQDRHSMLSQSFQLILDCERGDWSKIADFAKVNDFGVEKIARLHHQSIKWVMDFEASLKDIHI